jgi:DNA-binding transcriptional LysR family regulator
MKMMGLNHLNHLVALADECHFARAASRVHLSQPAFSRSIQTIERNVGMQLFERQAGDVRPTPAGRFLIDRARKLLFDARSVARDFDLYCDSQLGDTAFGVGPFPTALLLQPVVCSLRNLYPKIGLRIEVKNWEQLLERLVHEDIEFFVADARDIAESDALHVQSLARLRGGFYVRRAHPLGETEHTIQDVWAYGVAATRLPNHVRGALGRLLGLPPEEQPRLVLECDDVNFLHNTALQTDTVVVTIDCAAQAYVQEGRLRKLRITRFPDQYVEMSIVRLRNRSLSPMAQETIKAFRQFVDANMPEGLSI